MRNSDLNRVEFYSKEDMAGPHQLSKGEHILRSETKSTYIDINDVLELYNIKKYIDNELYLKSWTEEDIANFKLKSKEYGRVIGQFMFNINDSNIIGLYANVLRGYTSSFWELVSNQAVFKRIAKTTFVSILSAEQHIINDILTHKSLVEHYNAEMRDFLLAYTKSAEILLSVYEVEDDFHKVQKFIPKSLTIADKESIISNYLDSGDANLNYVELVQNARNKNDFKVSDKTRLKAKRLHKVETEKFFAENEGMKYGVSVSFPENVTKIKDGFVDKDLTAHYSYSLDFIRQNNDPYILFQNFKYLFEYVDKQGRINLISKKSQIGLFERIMGIHSQNEYKVGSGFSLSEMTSHAQIFGYSKIITDLNSTLEDILHIVFTRTFHEKYNFAENAHFPIPSSANSHFEKVRLLAPEFESVLKQYKLFVEDGSIDFELLQISSSPTAIKDIPSLNQNKYIYFNDDNTEMASCSNLFFSDQTLLAYVEPFKEKQYHNLFELLTHEQVNFNNYEEYQKPKINYLVSKGFIAIAVDGLITLTNPERLLIIKDLYDNECASFYHYQLNFQEEARQMATENIVLFESSLFSKPEQAYFNYFLNKSEFTNGLDLRNSYLHGTQANSSEIQKHQYAYFTYMKLLILVMLKIDDDLQIHLSNIAPLGTQ